ncbi:MAG: substrate-binding domain-containing protein, partial [Gammaproteobacteria bacterium]
MPGSRNQRHPPRLAPRARGLRVQVVVCLGALLAPAVHAAQATVAVATNFLVVLEQLAPAFERASAHTVVLVAGSTGKLYAQVGHGAPFDVLLAAD